MTPGLYVECDGGYRESAAPQHRESSTHLPRTSLMPILSGVSGNCLVSMSPDIVDAGASPLGAAPIHEPLGSLATDPADPADPSEFEL